MAITKSAHKHETLDRCLCRLGMGLYAFNPLPDPDELIRRLKVNHVQALVFWVKDKDGQFNTPEFQKMVLALRQGGIVPILVMAYGVFWGGNENRNRWALEHPDWQVDTGEPNSQYMKNHYLCLNSPFWRIYLEWVRELIRDNDLGGIIFDELHAANCRCVHCQTLYRRETGGEIPALNFDDPAFRAYIRWCYRRRVELMRELVQTARTAEPGLPISLLPYFNNGWPDAHSAAEAGPLFDGASLDVIEYLKCSQLTRLFRSVMPRLRPEIWTSNSSSFRGELYYGKLNLTTHEAPMPFLQFLAEGLSIIANGGVRNMDYYRLEQGGYPRRDGNWDNHRRANAEILKRAPWLESAERSVATVVMSYSQRTHDYYDRLGENPTENWGGHYLKEYTGVYRALMEKQVLFDVIPDEWLQDDRLSPYQVVVLPSNVCLADAEADALDRFVSRGGGLVVTYRAGLMDETGAPRKEFALANLVGAEWLGEGNPDYDLLSRFRGAGRLGAFPCKGIYLRMEKDFGTTRSGNFPVATPRFCWDVPFLKTALRSGAEAVGFLQEGETFQFKQDITFAAERHPAVIVRRHGQGTVVFLPFCAGTLYHYHRQIWAKELLDAAVRWAHPGRRLPIEVQAPPQCEANAFWQANRRRLVIHLNNYQGLLLSGLISRGDISPNVEYIPPLLDVAVEVDVTPYGRPARVYRAPEQQELKPAWSGERLTVHVPRIDNHSMIVLEFG